jgi:hypothetical protein
MSRSQPRSLRSWVKCEEKWEVTSVVDKQRMNVGRYNTRGKQKRDFTQLKGGQGRHSI